MIGNLRQNTETVLGLISNNPAIKAKYMKKIQGAATMFNYCENQNAANSISEA